MPTRVFGDDFEAGTDRESEQGDEGILVADAVHVVTGGLLYHGSGGFGGAEEGIQDVGVDLWRGIDFFGGAGADSAGVLGNEGTNKPLGDAARMDFVNRLGLAAFEGFRNGADDEFISAAEVIEALSDAPGTWFRLPVQLSGAESSGESGCAEIGSVQLRDQAGGPHSSG